MRAYFLIHRKPSSPCVLICSKGNKRPESLLLLLLLSHFSRVQLCATPKTAAHQAPPCLGFSRQEHWSGLPFPSPIHESEEWKWSRSVVSDSLRPPWIAAYQAPPSMGFSRQEYWSGVPVPSPRVSLRRAVILFIWFPPAWPNHLPEPHIKYYQIGN